MGFKCKFRDEYDRLEGLGMNIIHYRKVSDNVQNALGNFEESKEDGSFAATALQGHVSSRRAGLGSFKFISVSDVFA